MNSRLCSSISSERWQHSLINGPEAPLPNLNSTNIFFYGRFGGKLPNLKIANISGYTVYNIYRLHGTNSMKWRVLWALIWHACVYVQNVEPSHAPSAEATYHPSNSAKNRYANIIACKKLCCTWFMPTTWHAIFVNPSLTNQNSFIQIPVSSKVFRLWNLFGLLEVS